MCGIAGFLGSFEESLLLRMGASIAHRGPDATGTFYVGEDRIGLVHQRLSIQDLSERSNQPMTDAHGMATICYNGEIYNFPELRSALEQRGVKFQTTSDTEVILQLYLHEGTGFLGKLNGIFAFAIWDHREKTLFLARDGLGVKPLYFCFQNEEFIFASEIKAILQEKRVSREINHKAIGYHLSYLWSPAPDTMLKAVKKLEPGNALIVKDGRVVKHWCFYDLPYNEPIQDINEQDAAEQVRAAVEQAVQSQLISDVPVGAFLSGGLDSSAICAIAAKSLGADKLPCFTIGIKGEKDAREGMIDDLPFAEKAAKHLGVKLNTIWVGPEVTNDLRKMIYLLDEPQADPAPLNVMHICRLAKENGIKVLLSGAGGDDIFTGYIRHYALDKESTWGWLPKPARRLLSFSATHMPKNHTLTRRLSKALRYAHLSPDERMIRYFQYIQHNYLRTIYSKDMAHYLDDFPVDQPMLDSLQKLDGKQSQLRKMLYLEGKHFMVDHNLNYTDKMGMAEGVEVRVPLIDPRLVQLAVSLPDSLKQRGLEGKWIFKKAMESYLPKEIIYRPKTGFGAPLRTWLHKDLRELVYDSLSEESIKRRGFFDYAGVKRVLDLDRTGKTDAAYSILAMVCIEQWCRIFIDQETPGF